MGATRRWSWVVLSFVAVLALVLGFALTTGDPVTDPSPGLGARLAQSLAGHSALVWEIAFSPDGSHLASGSVDRTVRIWRWPEGKLERILRHPQGVTCLAFSSDGERLVTGSYDGAIRIWRVRDGVLVRTLAGHLATVWAVAFSPDGTRLASGGEDKTVRLWRSADGVLLETLTGHGLNVWSVALSADGRVLASGSFDRTVKLWRADTGALIRTLAGHEQAVVSVAIDPGSRRIASGGDDSTVRIWRLDDGELELTLRGGSEHVYAVAFSPDGRWLASGSREKGNLATLWKQLAGERWSGGRRKTVRLWRVGDGSLQQAVAGPAGDVHAVAFSPDGGWLAACGEDPAIHLWRLSSATDLQPVDTEPLARGVRR